jgi:tRNA threonylcarbamoyladenosine biosynthesis protein TsaE
MLDFISHSTKQTFRIGQRLGGALQQGDVLLLIGELGVGKTQLVKGIVAGMGSEDLVTSPSFVLVNEYTSPTSPTLSTPSTPSTPSPPLTIYHMDLYRLDDPAELTTIGTDDMWDGMGVCLIEWANRAEEELPYEHLAIHMQHLDETKRVLRFAPRGDRYQALVAIFKNEAFG